jgi:hypothetical protein
VKVDRYPFSSSAIVNRSKRRNNQPGARCSGHSHDYDYEHEHEQEQETVIPMGSLWNQFKIQHSKFSIHHFFTHNPGRFTENREEPRQACPRACSNSVCKPFRDFVPAGRRRQSLIRFSLISPAGNSGSSIDGCRNLMESGRLLLANTFDDTKLFDLICG